MAHWLDRAYVRLTQSGSFFRDGWGDDERLSLLSTSQFAADPHEPPITWSLARSRSGALERDGTFESPLASLLDRESRVAHVRWIEPGARPARAVCVLLGATGDEGFARRTRWARPLLREGVGAMILENPLYGVRRPRGQRGVEVRTVADLLLLGRAAVEEARSLAGWLHRERRAVAVSGYSMGGQLAAMTGALLPFPSAVVAAAAPSSATAVFVDGLLSRATAWGALAGGGADARARLSSMLDGMSLATLPRPIAPHAAILVGARDDGYVAPRHVEALHRHWHGAELRWIEGGHVSGYVTGAPAVRRALLDAIGRLNDG